jgi:vacuolar-type H+-ATPase subunit E/Vma4
MSLYAILESIRASGDSQVRKIEAQAYIQCNEILANARLEAEQVKIDAHKKAVAPAFKERARMIQRARLEALQILGDVREEFVKAALSQIHTQLANTRTGNSYPQILHRLVEEALAELDGSLTAPRNVQLEADPRDREVLESVLHDLGLELSVRYELNCWGGLNARSQDGRIVAINTLEARLERATPYLRRYLSALFENQGALGEVIQITEKQFASI